jgi:FKBP-type peptidyl-prolyl cis-trans isomerase
MLAVVAAIAMITCNVLAAEEKKATTQPTTKSAFASKASEKDQLSYAIGFDFGNRLKGSGVNLNVDVFAQAIKDVLGDKEPAMTKDEVIAVLMNFQKNMQAKAEKEIKEIGDKNLAEGKAFLEANAKKEGVKTLPSGLQYKVIKEGTGKTPKASDKVKVNYVGKFIDGKEFDTSASHGGAAEFNADQVIPGWTEALTQMKEGSKWELFIPSSLAYGEMGSSRIPPNSTLVFEVELLSVEEAKAAPAETEKK